MSSKKKDKDRKRRSRESDGQEHPHKKLKEEQSNDEDASHGDSLDNSDGTWQYKDHVELLKRLKAAIPSDEVKNSYKSTQEKTDWESISFPPFTGQQCRDEWLDLSKKIRKVRNLTEIVEEAESLNEAGMLTKPKRMPVRPVSVYFRFLIARKRKMSAKYPDMTQKELTKLIAKKYAELSEKKKKKYQAAYDEDLKAYKEAQAKYKEEHRLPRKTSAIKLYIAHKVKESQGKGTEKTEKELQEHYQNKWSTLKKKKKIRFINEACDAQTSYNEKLEKYLTAHPDVQPPKKVRSFLNKEEQMLKDANDGKPVKPETTGYRLFVNENWKKVEGNGKEKNSALHKQWEDLPETTKLTYSERVQQRLEDYKREYEVYVSGLSQEERDKMPQTNLTKKKNEPLPALDIYINETKESFVTAHPDLDDDAVIGRLVKQFNNLPATEKEKYLKREKQLGKSRNSLQKPLFPGEPKKPVETGYMLFCKEHMKISKSMSAAGAKWREMSEADKNVFNRMRDKRLRKYHRQLEAFKQNLTDSDQEKYKQLHQTNRKPRKSKKSSVTEKASVKSDESDQTDSDTDKEGHQQTHRQHRAQKSSATKSSCIGESSSLADNLSSDSSTSSTDSSADNSDSS